MTHHGLPPSTLWPVARCAHSSLEPRVYGIMLLSHVSLGGSVQMKKVVDTPFYILHYAGLDFWGAARWHMSLRKLLNVWRFWQVPYSWDSDSILCSQGSEQNGPCTPAHRAGGRELGGSPWQPATQQFPLWTGNLGATPETCPLQGILGWVFSLHPWQQNNSSSGCCLWWMYICTNMTGNISEPCTNQWQWEQSSCYIYPLLPALLFN